MRTWKAILGATAIALAGVGAGCRSFDTDPNNPPAAEPKPEIEQGTGGSGTAGTSGTNDAADQEDGRGEDLPDRKTFDPEAIR